MDTSTVSQNIVIANFDDSSGKSTATLFSAIGLAINLLAITVAYIQIIKQVKNTEKTLLSNQATDWVKDFRNVLSAFLTEFRIDSQNLGKLSSKQFISEEHSKLHYSLLLMLNSTQEKERELTTKLKKIIDSKGINLETQLQSIEDCGNKIIDEKLQVLYALH